MEIQPIVIGTAGHIDHGKSTLVRALTGVDPDRLKEEKERGLTIDLGFAPLPLPDGRLVGIVDVPGHERFIRNMVAGATGIDLVVLVVAADDAVMPQTVEHLQIMELLGVQRGLVALTKIDTVDPELVELAEEDVRECVAGTFLAEAPLLRVSAVTGEGLDELREVLFRQAVESEPRTAEGVFRMPVQRVFSKRGFGTVVTGIPVSGEARVGDVLEILPPGVRGKVRGLNAYNQTAVSVRGGHSSAINFSDVEHRQVHRGCVVATPGFFRPERMLAARLQALPSLTRPITNRMQVRVHAGTADAPGEVFLLDKSEIAPGETGLVQLRLQDPLVCAPGDRFVLRRLSPATTLGGGAILEESRHRLKRFRDFVLEGLSRTEESLDSPADLAEQVLARRRDELVDAAAVAVELKRPARETASLLAELEREGRVHAPRQDRWIHAERLAEARERLRTAVADWFVEAPHRSEVDTLELRRRTGFEGGFLTVVLEAEVAAGALEELPGGRVRDPNRSVELPAAVARVVSSVEERLAAAGFQPPSPEELAASLSVAPADVQRAIEHLADEGRVVRIGAGLFLARGAYDEARTAVTENCERNGQLEIPALRDVLGTTRKFLIPLLEHFDASGLTRRQGSVRVLRR